MLSLNRSLRTRACGNHGLFVKRICTVARGKYTFNIRFDAVHLHISCLVKPNSSGKDLGDRRVANRHKSPRNGNLAPARKLERIEARSVALERLDPRFHKKRDVLRRLDALHKNLRAPEGIAAMDESYRPCDARKVERVPEGRISASDYCHVRTLEERSVADGAGANAPVLVLRLTGKARPARACTRGHNDAPGEIAAHHSVKTLFRCGKIHRRNLVHLKANSRALGLRAHRRHERHPGHRLGKSREVLHIGRLSELPARKHTLYNQRLKPGSRGIDPCRKPSGTAAHDYEVLYFFLRHIVMPSLTFFGSIKFPGVTLPL